LETGVAQTQCRLGYGLEHRGSVPGWDIDGNFSPRHQIQTDFKSAQLHTQWVSEAITPGLRGRNVMLITPI